jgi:hypothetical protein
MTNSPGSSDTCQSSAGSPATTATAASKSPPRPSGEEWRQALYLATVSENSWLKQTPHGEAGGLPVP